MKQRLIISGGGTGGHIFPALAIAQEWRKRWPDTDILFVGAKGAMEEEIIPRKGHAYKSVWISGIHRKKTVRNLWRNASFPLKLVVSLFQSRKILKEFSPDLVIGTGGFASGPMGRAATQKGIPLFILEANAYPGLVNRWLAPKAKLILLGNGDAKKYFQEYPTVTTGNPIRSLSPIPKSEAAKIMELDPSSPTLLSVGGSLGAASINRALLVHIDKVVKSNAQLIWQCGKHYYDTLKDQVPESPRVKLLPFIENMEAAYSLADVVISRAGGSTMSELIALNKASILIPSPNVAEDHQTKNALSLTEKHAALLVNDQEAKESLVDTALSLLNNEERLNTLKEHIEKVEKFNSAEKIVDEITRALT